MPYFVARVVLHGATLKEYIALHRWMRAEHLYEEFKVAPYLLQMPDATYFCNSNETLLQVETRVIKALGNTRFSEAADPDAVKPVDGTYSYFVSGPSISYKAAGLQRKRIPVAKPSPAPNSSLLRKLSQMQKDPGKR